MTGALTIQPLLYGMIDETDGVERQQLYSVLNGIPSGSVATYGQLAKLCQRPQHARWVGRILSQLPSNSALPWHRVINAQGRLSFPQDSARYLKQQQRLADEGVLLHNGRIRLKDYQWCP